MLAPRPDVLDAMRQMAPEVWGEEEAPTTRRYDLQLAEMLDGESDLHVAVALAEFHERRMRGLLKLRRADTTPRASDRADKLMTRTHYDMATMYRAIALRLWSTRPVRGAVVRRPEA